MVTPEQLRAVQQEVERTGRPYKAALHKRKELVAQAVADGMRPAHAARAAGLSRQSAGKLRQSH